VKTRILSRHCIARLSLILFFGSLTQFCNVSYGQAFPSRPVKIIIPYPPGGSAEVQARIVGQKLSEIWGQPVIIDYKPGAGTTIGANYVASAAPDGYTLYLAGTSHAVSGALYKNLNYDVVKSFSPISLIATSPFLVVTPIGKPFNSVKDLVDAAKANPGEITYASSGSGTGPHLSGELFRSQAGINVTHIPYKGTSPALTALVGGQVDFMIADIAASSLIKGGKLKVLALTTGKRSPQFEGVPTLAESGYPNLSITNWSGILAPANTPTAIINKINADIVSALSDPDIRNRYRNQDLESVSSSPKYFSDFIASESQKYSKAIKDAGIIVD